MTLSCSAPVQVEATFELLSAEKCYRKWRVRRGSEVFYVVICKPWGDGEFRWLISPNGARWADVTRDELRRYLDGS